MLKYKKQMIVYGIGFLAVTVFMLPYMILGENAYILIFDNLNSEILFNKLNAKYFFKFRGTVPELMNIDVGALNSFSMFEVLFYMIFPPYAAYIINEWLVRLVAFAGMYLFLNLIFKNRYDIVAAAVSICFALAPLYSVYGLTAAGLPLLCWAFYNIFKQKNLIWAYSAVAFYTVSSSLILSGYFVIIILFVMCCYFLYKFRFKQLHFYIASAMSVFLYLLCNLKLIVLMLSGYKSHRDIWEFHGNPNFGQFIREIYDVAFFGFFPARIFTVALFVIALGGLVIAYIKKHEFLKPLAFCFCTALILGLIFSYLDSSFNKKIVTFFGAQSFDFNRIFHILPMLWHVAAALGMAVVFDYIKNVLSKYNLRKNIINAITTAAIVSLSVIALVIPHLCDFKEENYATNVRAVFGQKSAKTFSYGEFFDEKLFTEIDGYIGADKSTYRVGCIGIYPAIATYNGFYSLDGFVQNYSLEYYNRFKRIIEPEIAKDPVDLDFTWANQCFLFNNDVRDWSAVKNSGKAITDLAFNLDAFYEMGGRYIFSAVPILNFSGTGNLTPANGGNPFTHNSSRWEIWVYSVTHSGI